MCKLARLVTAIFIFMTFIAASWPFIMIMIHGINATTSAMLLEHLPYLLVLVFLALSFRFMDKRETLKRRRIGLGMFFVIMTLVLIGSFYLETALMEEQERHVAEQRKMQEMHLKIRQENAINNAITGMINSIKEKKTLDVSRTSK